MTRRFYFEEAVIAEEKGGTMTWRESFEVIHQIASTQGPNECFTDSDSMSWTGDDFWDYAGDLRWAR